IKAYVVRGVVPDDFDAEIARAVGGAFARVAKAPSIVIAYDMRPSSPELSQAFADGVMAQGVDVVFAGLGSTDMLYFASGHLDMPGAMFTASHNPAKYNGIKMCYAGAAPVVQDSGLAEIRTMAEEGVPSYDGARGTSSERDVLAEYAAYLNKLVPLGGSRPLRVVVDAGNGMGGYTVPVVLEGLPFDVDEMYFELDGNFPNHEANPLDPKNLVDLQARVVEVGADIGLAFDGDADRVFVIDENGDAVTPSAVTALVAVRELAKAPGASIIHNLITSKAVPEIIREHGGRPIRSRVGHSFIKGEMAATGAVFGGEHSAHYYFKDFWKADTGMLAAMHVLAALGEQDQPLSALTAEYSRYVASGEINSTVENAQQKMKDIETVYADKQLDHLDGLTVDAGEWWFNVRASNTEPLLRLNVEGPDRATMEKVRDDVLALIRGTNA
ncbi:MAG: phosphomannomutase, partial [Frankiaceae bacterium]|nr:phosphomannomutase [Frankiaceae bacterium]